MALLHITEIPIFPGYPSLGDVLQGVHQVVSKLQAASERVLAGVATINEEDLQKEWIRVPLDVQRTGMRSLQWLPYMLTEETVSSQKDLLIILSSLESLQVRTRRVVPLLVDMDIHYRILKLIYGNASMEFDFGKSMSSFPVLFGVYHDNILFLYKHYCNHYNCEGFPDANACTIF